MDSCLGRIEAALGAIRDGQAAISTAIAELKVEIGHQPTKHEVDRLLWRVGRWVIGITLAALLVIVRWDAIVAAASRLVG